MIAWAWEGTAAGSAGCGISDDEHKAQEAAETWLRANPGATAFLDTARLADGTTTLSAYWARYGRVRRSRRLRDGRIVWARVPVPLPGRDLRHGGAAAAPVPD